jgi:alkylation response protein AidB-like acyl-CoA dehydrogenase
MQRGIELRALTGACDVAVGWPVPGGGQTRLRFELLSAVSHDDLVLGRLVEAHADAVAITAELGQPLVHRGQRWGVWAAGPPDSLCAHSDEKTWRLEGSKAWCSGAALLTHALVDASTTTGQRLFAVNLDDPGIEVCAPTWAGPGMMRADTRLVRFHKAAARSIGQPGQYLSRPGFWAGGIGVAACWHGGTVAAARPLLLRSRHAPEAHLLAHLGAVHVALQQNRAILAVAAAELDRNFGQDHQLLAGSVRTTVERNAINVIDRVGRALGPGPLAHDGDHAALIADLSVYVRQHHGERDLETIGCEVSRLDEPWPV